jgi:dTDP-4-amino-4,6-dideoxygalactose transaminase
MKPEAIPFNRATSAPNEQSYIASAIAGGHLAGDGLYTKSCSDFLERLLGVRKCLLTTSCTHALEMAALLLDIEPGDEVIVPSFTFVSTANAFALRGARIVFADIRPDTLNIDEKLIESLISSRTKAIVVVHYAGVACEMDAIAGLARKYGVSVIEDNAHGLFSRYKGRLLGTFGAFATQSFHETKNITCGEGGALLINDPNYVEEAEIVREKGTNRARFFRGQVDKYTWIALGSSYLPSEILAAFLYAQLEHYETIQNKRKIIWKRYNDALAGWSQRFGIGLPNVPGHCEQSYHMYYVIMPDLATRQGLISYLKDAGVSAVFHYLPLHLSEMGMRLGGRSGDCPVTEDLSDRLLRLPFFTDLSESDQVRVIESVTSFVPREATHGVS